MEVPGTLTFYRWGRTFDLFPDDVVPPTDHDLGYQEEIGADPAVFVYFSLSPWRGVAGARGGEGGPGVDTGGVLGNCGRLCQHYHFLENQLACGDQRGTLYDD